MNERTKTNILIVDDESSIREVLQRTLEASGFTCGTACNVDEALMKLSEAEYGLVLSDIMMPGRTGVELLQEIKARYPDTAVIMVTAVSDVQTAINAMKQGAYDYVTKPFNILEVTMSVERALEKRTLLITNREYREHLEQKVEEQTDEIRATFLGAVKSLAEALEAKDPYTNGHSKRVTEVTVTLATEASLPELQLDRIRLAGLVHDIGKIGIPEQILHKPDKLTDAEYEMIKEHSVIGQRILRPIIRDQEVLRIVRHHHERYDGSGYPDGISGDAIPECVRLIAVADTYDAMTSNRPYRKALTPEIARELIVKGSGTQFDPEAVELFLATEMKLPFCPLSAAPRETS